MSGVAAVKHKQKKYVEKFKELGALDAEHAISLNEVGITGSYVFDRMVAKKIFIKCNNSKFYLNISAFDSYRKAKQKLGLSILVILFLFLAFYYSVINK